MQVRSLSWEDLLEEGMATQSSILALRNPWTEEPGGLQSTSFKESDTTERLNNSNGGWSPNRQKRPETHRSGREDTGLLLSLE